MDRVIDLRSDTVTMPTPNMKSAIQTAALGDDVFEEDPTVNELEAKSAELLGFESAIFVPSGTMGNLVAVMVHCERGAEVIVGDKSHTFVYEAGGISALGGVHSHQLPNLKDGTIELDRIRSAVRADNVHFPVTRLICLENTHNMCFGTPLSENYLAEVAGIAKEFELKIHVDGARIFNAAAALNVPAKNLVSDIDSISFCLSKGLSAPAGSLLCGSYKFIKQARRIRKSLGGGMRQAGILAAAGIVALDEMIPQLALDHQNARILADGLNSIDGLGIDMETVQTNLVFFTLETDEISAANLVEQLERRGIRFLQTSPNRFRMVPHYGIETEDIHYTLDQLRQVL